MSHDIRTPMNAIVGMTAIASANLDNPAQVRDCLRKITLSSQHLLGLINDVLDMSKIESGKLTLNIDLLSLREATENIVNIIQPQIKAQKQQFDIIIRDIQPGAGLLRRCAAEPGSAESALQRPEVHPGRRAPSP